MMQSAVTKSARLRINLVFVVDRFESSSVKTGFRVVIDHLLDVFDANV